MAQPQRVSWKTWRAVTGGGFLLFCFCSLVLEIADQMKAADALRRPRNGIGDQTGIRTPAKAAASTGATFAARGVPPVLADQLDNLAGWTAPEPTYQPVMILGDKPLQCQCGARAVFMVLEHEGNGDERPDGAPSQTYGFGGFCASCWAKLDQLGKL
jgi:hypothetical protein